MFLELCSLWTAYRHFGAIALFIQAQQISSCAPTANFPHGCPGCYLPREKLPPPCEIYASGGGLLIVPTNALLLWYQWWYWSCWSRDNHKAKIDDTSFRFCRDYDLCATCEKRGADVHDPSHVLLKMSLPCNKAQLSRVCVEGVLRRCITESPRSVFVPDLTKTTPLNVVCSK